MQYPCITYELDDVNIQHADNNPYRHQKRWQVTIIDADPDSEIPDQVARLRSARFDRAYPADNLNHTVYTLFF